LLTDAGCCGRIGERLRELDTDSGLIYCVCMLFVVFTYFLFLLLTILLAVAAVLARSCFFPYRKKMTSPTA